MFRPQTGDDVRFSFSSAGKELFANSTVLATTAPARFLAPFCSGAPANFVMEDDNADEEGGVFEYDDADLVTDRIIWPEKGALERKVRPSFHKIEVPAFALTTWLAVLHWIQVGTIQFAPLPVTLSLGKTYRAKWLYIALCHQRDKDSPVSLLSFDETLFLALIDISSLAFGFSVFSVPSCALPGDRPSS